LLQNKTFTDGVDPLGTPTPNIPASVVTAQSILFASLAITLFVAFIAVLGKQWIMWYTRATMWGNIVHRGKEHQIKFAGLQKWGFHLIMESLPVMLQFALLLLGIALTIYLWDLNISVARVVLVVTSIGIAFYACITVASTIYSSCPFRTPLSVLFLEALSLAKEFTAISGFWLRRMATWLLHAKADTFDYPTALSNPVFWRKDPHFASPTEKDITGVSAGVWLLENSTDSSVAFAVLAVLFESQWLPRRRSVDALIRLRDTYTQCCRAPEFDKSTRLKALQSAAAYYVLYHTQLIWSASNSHKVRVVGLPPDLPSDLLLYQDSDKWDRDDMFEYLLRIEDHSESVTSMRFLSYIAPYWFCGDSDPAVTVRWSRLDTLNKLIAVLEENQALDPVTLTDCFLCAGVVVDLPIHPEDLARADKRCVPPLYSLTAALIGVSEYVGQTFKAVVEHIHGMVLAQGPKRAEPALDILLTLVRKTTLPLVDRSWINGLLKSAARGNMGDDTFTLFLRLSGQREKEDTTADVGPPHGQDRVGTQGGEPDPQTPGGPIPPETTTPEYTLFIKILRNVQACSKREGGWQDEAVYGGLIAMGDIPRLGSYLPDSDDIEMLRQAIERGQPFRVRKAVYDAILAARDGWLRSPELRQTLKDLDFPRQLYNVATEIVRPDYQRSFINMMETLSEDKCWHSYLRGAMEIWLPLRHEVPHQVLRIISRIGKLPLPEYDVDGPNPPHLDILLKELVEAEWAEVPGRPVTDLTPDRLEPLAEITKQFRRLVFPETHRRAVLDVVERVIPAFENRRDNGPGEDVRRIINDLLEELRQPVQSDQPSVYSLGD